MLSRDAKLFHFAHADKKIQTESVEVKIKFFSKSLMRVVLNLHESTVTQFLLTTESNLPRIVFCDRLKDAGKGGQLCWIHYQGDL